MKMTDGVEVKVLGTSFNLKAYADDPTVQASLVEDILNWDIIMTN